VIFLSGVRDVDKTPQMMKPSVIIALGVLKVKVIEVVKASMHWIVWCQTVITHLVGK
jgi:hypothetical protein